MGRINILRIPTVARIVECSLFMSGFGSRSSFTKIWKKNDCSFAKQSALKMKFTRSFGADLNNDALGDVRRDTLKSTPSTFSWWHCKCPSPISGYVSIKAIYSWLGRKIPFHQSINLRSNSQNRQKQSKTSQTERNETDKK